MGVGCTPTETPSRGGEELAATPAPPPIDARVMEILGAAKKRLAADRAVIQNDAGVESALARQRRQRDDSGMARHLVPPETSPEALAEMAREAATEAGLVVVSASVAAPTVAAPVPREHRGDGPYAYTREQLFQSFTLSLQLGRAERTDLGRWLAVLAERGQPIPFVGSVERRGDDVIASAQFLMEVDLSPPVHVLEPLDLEALARAAGVEPVPPEGLGSQRAAIESLIAEHGALRGELTRAVWRLGESHLEAARFRFFGQAAEQANALLKGKDHEHP
jgi:hypothetical protein